MKDLIARVEAASAGSRELDLLIERTFNTSEIRDDWLDRFPNDARHYTTSVDAALLLLPPGKVWNVSQVSDGTGAAFIWNGEVVFAATPALALVAAILRAKESEDGTV